MVRLHRSGAENLVCELACRAGTAIVIPAAWYHSPFASVGVARLQMGTAAPIGPLCVSSIPTLFRPWLEKSGWHVPGGGIGSYCRADSAPCHLSDDVLPLDTIDVGKTKTVH
eukprot:5629397-Pyramimonas_sp.AAC.1